MRGTAFYGSLRSKRGRNKFFFFWKVRHFVNFPKFTKSLRQYLGNLITNNEVFSFQNTDACCIMHTRSRFDHLFTNLITPLEQLM